MLDSDEFDAAKKYLDQFFDFVIETKKKEQSENNNFIERLLTNYSTPQEVRYFYYSLSIGVIR